MIHKAALLDTSFFLRFLNDEDPLFGNADGYFRYFIRNDITMMISTISIAEYCVGGDFSELPLRNLQIAPFNIDQAVRTGELARHVFKQKGKLKLLERNIIPNDTKLFAQADKSEQIRYYISSDRESKKIYDLLHEVYKLQFEFVDLSIPHHEYFGELNI